MQRQRTVTCLSFSAAVCLGAGAAMLITSPTAVLAHSSKERWPHLLQPIFLVVIGAGVLLLLSARALDRRTALLPAFFTTGGMLICFAGQRTLDEQYWLIPLLLLVVGGALFALGASRLSAADGQNISPPDPPSISIAPRFGRGFWRTSSGRLLRGAGLLALIALILAMGGILRLEHLDLYPKGSIGDESLNTSFVLDFFTGRPFMAPVYAKEFLFYLLGEWWMRWDSPSLVALRRLSSIIGLVTIPMMFLLGRQLCGTSVGLLAALFLGLSVWHVVLCRVAERQSLALLGIVLCYVAWFAALRGGSILLWAIAGATLGLGFHTWQTFKMMPAAIILLIVFHPRLSPLRRWFDRAPPSGFQRADSAKAPLPGDPRCRRKRSSLFFGLPTAWVAFMLVLLGPSQIHRDPVANMLEATVLGEIGLEKAVQGFENFLRNLWEVGYSLLGHEARDNFYLSQPFGVEACFVITLAICGLAVCASQIRRWPYAVLVGMLLAHSLPVVLSREVFQRRMQGLLIPIAILAGLAVRQWAISLRRQGAGHFVILLLLGAILAHGGLVLTRSYFPFFHGETDEMERCVRQAASSRGVYLDRERFYSAWVEVVSWEMHRGRYSLRWLPISPDLPIFAQDDRGLSLFLGEQNAGAWLEPLRLRFPLAEVMPIAEEGRLLGYEVLISGEEIRRDLQKGVPAGSWVPGQALTILSSSYLPLDLRSFAGPWHDGEVWDLRFSAPYFGSNANLRLDDLPQGLMVLGGVPFDLLPGGAVFLFSQHSPVPRQTVHGLRISLEKPWAGSAIHVLGLISPWLESQVTPSAVLRVERVDGSSQEIDLFAGSFRLENRDSRVFPYPVSVALQNRDTYMNVARLPLSPSPAITAIGIRNISRIESLLIAALTLEGRPAPGAQPLAALPHQVP